jgi:hypothetical protein
MNFSIFFFSPPFLALEKAEKLTPFTNHLVKIHKTNHTSTLELVKNGGV